MNNKRAGMITALSAMGLTDIPVWLNGVRPKESAGPPSDTAKQAIALAEAKRQAKREKLKAKVKR